MAKLPPDFVKPPVFDHPIRATAAKVAVNDRTREIVIRVDEKVWAALEAASSAENTTPTEIAKRILTEWLANANKPAAAAASNSSEPAHSGIIAQLVERVLGQLKRIRIIDVSWTWAVERARPQPRA